MQGNDNVHRIVDPTRPRCDTHEVLPTAQSATTEFLDAVLARDLPRACGLLHPGVDFRAMTPARIWEAGSPADVEGVLRAWFEHPERDVERVEPIEPQSPVEDTLHVGWRVHGQGTDGAFVYEQRAYVREDAGRIVWLRIMCSGPRPTAHT